MSTRITQRDIAQALGLSVQTISMALRDHKDISAETKSRIRAKAAEMRYMPDAGLKALADYRTRKRKTAVRWSTVALVHNWPSPKAWKTDPYYQKLTGYLKASAQARGIAIEEHWLGPAGEKATSVFRLLLNRGISGVFIAPPAITPDETRIEIPAQNFQVVTLGPEHMYPNFHTVQIDYYENLRLAWKVLRQRGHDRIGLIYQKRQGWRTGHAWRAAYTMEQHLAGFQAGDMEPLELETFADSRNRGTYLKWFRRHRFHAVISSDHQVEQWNAVLRKQPEVAIINVTRRGQKGIDLNLPQIAETAIELLYLEMQRSLVSQKSLPFRVHIPGKWIG